MGVTIFTFVEQPLFCSHCAGRDLQNLYTHDTEEIKKETARIFSRLVDK